MEASDFETAIIVMDWIFFSIDILTSTILPFLLLPSVIKEISMKSNTEDFKISIYPKGVQTYALSSIKYAYRLL